MPQSYKTKLDAVDKAKKKLDKITKDIEDDLLDAKKLWAAYSAKKKTYSDLWKKKNMGSTMKIQPQEVYQLFDDLKRDIDNAFSKYMKIINDLWEDDGEWDTAMKEFMRAADDAGLTK